MLNEAMSTYLTAKDSAYYEAFEFKAAFGSAYIGDTFKTVTDNHIVK